MTDSLEKALLRKRFIRLFLFCGRFVGNVLPCLILLLGAAGLEGGESEPERSDLWTLYDSKGFSNDELYPLGDLQSVADGRVNWTPASGRARPGEIVEVDDGPAERALRRYQIASAQRDADLIDFPPVSSTRLVIAFDARVSTTESRTLDLFLLRPGMTAPAHQGSILMWGYHPGYLSYFDGDYNELTPIDDDWNSYEMVNHLDANTFDLRVNGELIASDLPWRNRFSPGTAFGRLRIGAVRGEEGDYADITNIRIHAEPTPPTISMLSPSSASGIVQPDEFVRFQVSSDVPVDESSINVRVNGREATGRFEISGTPTKRDLTLVDASGLEENKTYQVTITATNERGTTTSEHNVYTFVDAVDGYRGIWFTLGQLSGEYGDKYAGGLAFCFSHTLTPMAVYAPEVDKTFFVYGGTTGPENRYLLIMGAYYDHARHVVSRPVIIRDQRGVDDPHDNPSLTIDGDGHVWVFVAGRGRRRPGQIFRSTEPYSVREFEQIVDRETTYSQVWYVPGKGFLHLQTLYTRGRELYWETSVDGRDWTDEPADDLPKLAGFGGHYQVSRIDPEKKRVGTAFNYHPRGVDTRTNIYYVETDDFGETWKTIGGEVVSTPLEHRDNPALAVDYEAEERLAYITKLLFDDDGYPVVLAVTSGGHEPGPQNDPRIWEIIRWTGQEWKTVEIARSDHNYDMGSLYIDGDRWTVIGPALEGPQSYHTGGEVGLWESLDNGYTWSFKKAITRESPFNHSYVRRPHNPVDPFYAMWADGDSSDFSISRLYFTDSEGEQLYKLPYHMDGEEAEPISIERPRRSTSLP